MRNNTRKWQQKVLLCAGFVAVLGTAVPPVAQAQSIPAGGSGVSQLQEHPLQEQRVPVVFSGGHETDRADRGRPVVLVAGALGVTPAVFREAFRSVRPAPAGMPPHPEQARQNKAALLRVLGPYGVSNDRLDAVSNYYRYVPSRGEMWPNRPARAYALVRNGTVAGYVVTDPGSGYSSAPTVTVPGIEAARAKITLSFNKNFEENGAVASIAVDSTKN